MGLSIEGSEVWLVQQYADFLRPPSHVQNCDIIRPQIKWPESMSSRIQGCNAKCWTAEAERSKAKPNRFAREDGTSLCTWMWWLQITGSAQRSSADSACCQSFTQEWVNTCMTFIHLLLTFNIKAVICCKSSRTAFKMFVWRLTIYAHIILLDLFEFKDKVYIFTCFTKNIFIVFISETQLKLCTVHVYVLNCLTWKQLHAHVFGL